MIAVIGHELQHVLEVFREGAKESPDNVLDTLGASQVTFDQYETQAAIDVGTLIHAELRQKHHSTK